MKERLVRLWLCKIWKWHDWTCAAEQGIKPTEKQVKSGVAGFQDYATAYCARKGCDARMRPMI